MSQRIRTGLTMLEVMIAVAILGGLMAMIAESLRSGSSMSGAIQSATEADNVAHHAVSTLVSELRTARKSSIAFSAASPNQIQFEICTSFDSSGLPQYGRPRRWQISNNQLVRITDPGTASARTDIFARNLPTNATLIAWDGSDECYTVALDTSYEDARGLPLIRHSVGRVFLRAGSVAPDGQYGEVVIGGVSTSGGSTTGGSTTGGSTTGGSTTGGSPTVKVYPTVWISLVRSGKNTNQVLAGDVGATANGDTVTSLVFTEDLVNWSNTNMPTGMNTSSAKMAINMTSMKGQGVTVTLTATTASGGSTTVTKTATSNSGISY